MDWTSTNLNNSQRIDSLWKRFHTRHNDMSLLFRCQAIGYGRASNLFYFLAEKEYLEYLESISAIREDGTIGRFKIKYQPAQTIEDMCRIRAEDYHTIFWLDNGEIVHLQFSYKGRLRIDGIFIHHKGY